MKLLYIVPFGYKKPATCLDAKFRPYKGDLFNVYNELGEHALRVQSVCFDTNMTKATVVLVEQE